MAHNADLVGWSRSRPDHDGRRELSIHDCKWPGVDGTDRRAGSQEESAAQSRAYVGRGHCSLPTRSVMGCFSGTWGLGLAVAAVAAVWFGLARAGAVEAEAARSLFDPPSWFNDGTFRRRLLQAWNARSSRTNTRAPDRKEKEKKAELSGEWRCLGRSPSAASDDSGHALLAGQQHHRPLPTALCLNPSLSTVWWHYSQQGLVLALDHI
jgi:hypothetical protein